MALARTPFPRTPLNGVIRWKAERKTTSCRTRSGGDIVSPLMWGMHVVIHGSLLIHVCLTEPLENCLPKLNAAVLPDY